MKKGRDREKKEKTDDYSGHYVIASSGPPERGPLERRLLVPIASLAAFAAHARDSSLRARGLRQAGPGFRFRRCLGGE